MLVSSMTHFVWLITYDSYLFLVVIRMDIIWQWLQFILIGLAHSLVFKNTALFILSMTRSHSLENIWRVPDDLNKTVFSETNNSPAKLPNSISSVSLFWQIRWKMTWDLRLVTYLFSPKYSLIPWTCEIFRFFSELKEYLSMKYMQSWVKAVKILVDLQEHWIELKSQVFTIYSFIHITSDRFCVSRSVVVNQKFWFRMSREWFELDYI